MANSKRVSPKPNAVQKQLMSDIAEWAENWGMHFLYGCDCPKGFQLHHVLGRTAIHNKVPIGHEFIIPVPFQYHDNNEKNDLNVTYFKHNFTGRFGKQTAIYHSMYQDMNNDGYKMPSVEVFNAIMDTNA